MATAMKSITGKSLRVAATRRVAAPKAVRAVKVFASADRPLWYPGNKAPAYLDGSLPGDHGFDPLSLGSDPESLKWFQQAELQNGRWAMLGVAGILFTSIGRQAGAPFPDWYDAGAVLIKDSPIPLGTQIFTLLILFGWVETKRLYDMRNPGSQGDGSFFGITDGFKGKEVGYPGGPFDPLGMARGDNASYQKYKVNEIKNGRLAMIAFVGFIAQHHATGKSPIENLVDHVSNPTGVTFATNGVSVPHFTEF